jgi:hypothetical protein
MLKASYAHARDDFRARRVADLKTEIGIMARATEKNLAAARSGLDRESVLDLEEALAAAKNAARQDDLEKLEKARDQFERATLPLAALLMDSVAKSALTGKTLDQI